MRVHFEASLDLQILFITTPIVQLWGWGADSFIPDSHSLLVEPFIEGKTHSVASSLLCFRSKMWFTRNTTRGREDSMERV